MAGLIRSWVALLLSVVLVSCAGEGNRPAATADETPAQPFPAVDSIALLPPGAALDSLENRAGSALLLERSGAAYEAGLAQRVTIEATSARFSPAWTDGSSSFETLAYAIYSFNVQTYHGAEVIRHEWGEAPVDFSNLWIGLANWPGDAWDWYPGSADGILDLQSVGYSDYTRPATGDMLVALVLLGTQQPLLDKLQVGEFPGEPISISGFTPSPAEGLIGSNLGFDVQFTGTVDGTTTYSWNFGGGATPNSPTEKNPTVTLGSTGSYDCSMTVDNDYGAPDTLNFTLEVKGPVTITGVTPNPAEGFKLYDLKFNVQFGGTNDGSTTYAWDFDGGATPNNPTLKSPTVKLGSIGTYHCSVSVDNDYGVPDIYAFDLEVNRSQQGDWWMFGRDRQHTRRSPYIGAQTDNVWWTYDSWIWMWSSPAIELYGTIYVGSDRPASSLQALNPGGTEKWSFDAGEWVRSSPAIGPDGTVYVGSWNDKVYAINADGTTKWSFNTGDLVDSSPAVGTDGTIYVGCDDGKLYAINPSGSLKWSYATGDWVRSSPAIGLDGTIYVGSHSDKLYAINPNGSLRWSYTTGGWVHSSPAIDADGTIHVGSFDGLIYAINSDGSLKWTYPTGNVNQYSSPAIGADGTIYVGSYDDKLHAINPDGSPQWAYTTGGSIYSSPAIGADGTIYVGSFDDKIYGINPDGSLLWSYLTGGDVMSSPAIGPDGFVYVGSNDGMLYAIGGGSHGQGEGGSL